MKLSLLTLILALVQNCCNTSKFAILQQRPTAHNDIKQIKVSCIGFEPEDRFKVWADDVRDIKPDHIRGSIATLSLHQRTVSRSRCPKYFGIVKHNIAVNKMHVWYESIFDPSKFIEDYSNANEINFRYDYRYYHNKPTKKEFKLFVSDQNDIQEVQIDDDNLKINVERESVKIQVLKSAVLSAFNYEESRDQDLVFWVERMDADEYGVVDQTLPKKVTDVFRSKSQKSRHLKKRIDDHERPKKQKDDVKSKAFNNMVIICGCAILMIGVAGFIFIFIKCNERSPTFSEADAEVKCSENI